MASRLTVSVFAVYCHATLRETVIAIVIVVKFLQYHNHRLRGSASTVLTATGPAKSMGDGEF